MDKLLIEIEINKKVESVLPSVVIENTVQQYLFELGAVTPGTVICDAGLKEHINMIRVCEVSNEKYNNSPIKIPSDGVDILYYVYQLSSEGPQEENLDDCNDENDRNDSPPSSNHTILPCYELEDLWENLIFEDDVKSNLIEFVKTSLLFSRHSVSKSVVTWNNVILLHGPPGTGKTSLCKALAQKLSIRLSKIYTHGQLIEINSHSLFSKWFSESGKLVLKMFKKIREWLNDTSGFVCLLIDEVESLAHSRTASLSNTEPADSMRVVNAVLTQIDRLKEYPNVLIMATSNIGEAIDIAFADRADLKQFIGLPSKLAIYKIYHSCITELISSEIVNGRFNDIFELQTYLKIKNTKTETTGHSHKLFNLAIKSEGMSGRVLRKIPFLAYAFFIKGSYPNLDEFLIAMDNAIDKHLSDSTTFMKSKIN